MRALSNDVRDLAIAFEARKVSVNQNKDGIILRLSIHPDECPQEIWKDWVGTRYQVAMVKIGDDEQPTAHDDVIKVNKAIASAGMLCREPSFQEWLSSNGYGQKIAIEDSEQWAIATLRDILGIQSRSDMRTDRAALEMFLSLRQDYMNSFDGT